MKWQIIRLRNTDLRILYEPHFINLMTLINYCRFLTRDKDGRFMGPVRACL